MLTKIPKHVMATIRKFISHSCDKTQLVNKSVGQSSSTWPPGPRFMETFIYNVWHVKNVSYTIYLTPYIHTHIFIYFEIYIYLI